MSLFGFGRKERRHVLVLMSASSSKTIQSLRCAITKKEFLREMSEFWDNHGTRCNDYDEVHAKFLNEDNK